MSDGQIMFIFLFGIILGMACAFYLGVILCRTYYFAVELRLREWFVEKLRNR